MIILLKGRGPLAKVPARSHEGDAGLDLFCTHDRIIWPWQSVDLDTGWDIKVPDGTWGLITGRSSTFTRRRLLVIEGVIDQNYTGKLSIQVWNPWLWPKKVRAGERLAQLVIVPLPDTKIALTTTMPVTERNRNCFGSTGA